MSVIAESIEYHLPVPTVVLMGWVTLFILFLISFFATRKMQSEPKGLQNFLEWILGLVFNLADEVVGPKAKNFYGLFAAVFLFIFTGNLLGLIPGFSSPTASLNTTVAIALVVFFSIHFFGIKEKGFLGYLSHYIPHISLPWYLKPLEFGVKVLMFIIEIISELARPLSLSFRLFGNLMAKEFLLGLLAMLVIIFLPSTSIVVKSLAIVPIILRPLIIVLGAFVSLIQAFVFLILSMIYIGGAVRHTE